MKKIQKVCKYKQLIQKEPLNIREPLFSLNKYCPGIISQYNKKDMIPLTGKDVLVRKSVAEKLCLANKSLQAIRPGYRLKVVYGYRHPKIQRKYFEEKKQQIFSANLSLKGEDLIEATHKLVAEPRVAGHPCGAAVDLTIVDQTNQEIDMGTKIADFSDLDIIKTFSQRITKKQRTNRELLLKIMTDQGFAPFYEEWWHFSYGDRDWACFYNKKNSLYKRMYRLF